VYLSGQSDTLFCGHDAIIISSYHECRHRQLVKLLLQA
jgi:bisphosphoglycerate-independent phosphoglycerate mutase (AlkP superfamily)